MVWGPLLGVTLHAPWGFSGSLPGGEVPSGAGAGARGSCTWRIYSMRAAQGLGALV